jgi:hypothetical protein
MHHLHATAGTALPAILKLHHQAFIDITHGFSQL